MFRTTLTTAVFALTLATGAQAAVVAIDSFASTTVFVGAPQDPSGTNPFTDTQTTGDAIGGSRTITNERTSMNGLIQGFQVATVVSGGVASVSLPAGVDGTSTFAWNAGGVDLTDMGTNDRIDINILSADLNGVTYTLELDGQSSSKVATAGGTLSFSFSEFGIVDGTNVSSISLLVSGPTSFDTSFDFIGAVPSTVPLPAAGFLTIAGLGALGAARARRK